MHMNMIALAIKTLTSTKLLLCTDSSQAHGDFMCKLACVLGLLFAKTVTVQIVKHVQ